MVRAKNGRAQLSSDGQDVPYGAKAYIVRLFNIGGVSPLVSSKSKTTPTTMSPASFVESVEHVTRREDAEKLLTWFDDVTGLKPRMWGSSIIGYGRYHYKYESGREGDAMLTGFSPRKSATTLYIMPGYRFGEMQQKLARLGKHKVGKSCLYINKLSDVDMDVLREIVEDGLTYIREKYDTWDE